MRCVKGCRFGGRGTDGLACWRSTDGAFPDLALIRPD